MSSVSPVSIELPLGTDEALRRLASTPQAPARSSPRPLTRGAAPRPAKPSAIIAQVDASGVAVALSNATS